MGLGRIEIALLLAAAVVVVAYVIYVLQPAVTSYERTWQRAAAAFLTLYILVTLLAIGGLAGLLVVWFYDRWA
ncbi:hypothetical protein JDY09_01370 [Thermoleophilum album]|uniref:hypothetical protein n=1 Tax=Thermoleophilum album TaxID=29539 RepID=UPI00237D2D6D|nr:hypothetical protein [Thermoleophilum album]MCL6440388.1 hypothetical protein [Thermoleophilum sp.]WDT93932.1 hypothetical protein JDY09_01370 [Thermoleophilum album]